MMDGSLIVDLAIIWILVILPIALFAEIFWSINRLKKRVDALERILSLSERKPEGSAQ